MLLEAAHALRKVYPRIPQNEFVSSTDKDVKSRLSAALVTLGVTADPDINQDTINDILAALNAAYVLNRQCKSNGVQTIHARRRTEDTPVEKILEYSHLTNKPKRASPRSSRDAPSHDTRLDDQVSTASSQDFVPLTKGPVYSTPPTAYTLPPQVSRYVHNSMKILTQKLGTESRQAAQRGMATIVSMCSSAQTSSTATTLEGDFPTHVMQGVFMMPWATGAPRGIRKISLAPLYSVCLPLMPHSFI